MLLAITQLFDIDVDVHNIATSLGSDVPYFLKSGTCLVGGIRESHRDYKTREATFGS